MSGRVRSLAVHVSASERTDGQTDVHRALMSACEAPGGRWKIWCGVGLRWLGKGKGGGFEGGAGGGGGCETCVGCKIVEVSMGARERASRYCDAELRVHDETGRVWKGGALSN